MANKKELVVFNIKKDNRFYFSFVFDKNELPTPYLDICC